MSAPIVSQWQKGVRNPTPAQLVKMANLAPEPVYFRLLELAGIPAADLKRFIPGMEEARDEYLRALDAHAGNTAAIPIVKTASALNDAIPDSREIEGWITVDTSYVPASARAIRVSQRVHRGFSSYPRQGDIAVLDVRRRIDAGNIEKFARQNPFAAVSIERQAEDSSQYRSLLSSAGLLPEDARPGFYVGALQFYELKETDAGEIRIHAGPVSSWIIAYRHGRDPFDGATTDLVDARTGAPIQQPAWRDTGGSFVLHPGVKFIFPILQLMHPSVDEEQ